MLLPYRRSFVFRGLHDIAVMLLNTGANPNAVTGPPRKTPLHIAASGGHIKVMQTLIRRGKASWGKTDDWGWTVLHEACVGGSKEIISYVFKECRELSNQTDKLGRTPLLVGLLSGIGEDAVKVLLEQGEDPSKEDQVGRGCPEAALLYCESGVLKIVLQWFLKSEGLDGVSKQLLMEIAEDHKDKDAMKNVICQVTNSV